MLGYTLIDVLIPNDAHPRKRKGKGGAVRPGKRRRLVGGASVRGGRKVTQGAGGGVRLGGGVRGGRKVTQGAGGGVRLGGGVKGGKRGFAPKLASKKSSGWTAGRGRGTRKTRTH